MAKEATSGADQPEATSGGSQTEAWTVRRILDWTTAHLKKHGSESARLEAEILLAHSRRCKRIELYTRFDEVVKDEQRKTMRELVNRRAQMEPVAYLVGYREFFGLNFRVTPDVLIPRPDTETLVLEAIDIAKPLASPRILDIGTGSGCIAIALAHQLPSARITATDVSTAALAIAAENARTHHVSERIELLEGDLFAPLAAGAKFDLVVSNPPYIADHEKETLQTDVQRYEPHGALFAGPTGLEVLNRIINGAGAFLNAGGRLLLEIAPEQAAALTEHIQQTGQFADVRAIKDLPGKVRVIRAKRT